MLAPLRKKAASEETAFVSGNYVSLFFLGLRLALVSATGGAASLATAFARLLRLGLGASSGLLLARSSLMIWIFRAGRLVGAGLSLVASSA